MKCKRCGSSRLNPFDSDYCFDCGDFNSRRHVLDVIADLNRLESHSKSETWYMEELEREGSFDHLEGNPLDFGNN